METFTHNGAPVRAGALPQYQEMAARLRAQILAQKISGKIPPERELARQFGVSYMTARKAIGLLVEEGLLLREHGQGTFVRSPGQRTTLRSAGLLLPAGASGGAANPYYAHIIAGACAEAVRRGVGLAISDSLHTLFQPEASRSVRMADGLIVCPGACSGAELAKVARFLPVVLLEWSNLRFPALTVDNHGAMREPVEFLVGLGHKHIAFIGGPQRAGVQSAPARERLEGFIAAMTECGLSVREEYIRHGDYEFASGVALARELLTLKNRPTAICCANDTMALGVMRYAAEAGLRIPDDLSVCGFDDIGAAALCTPSLTTVCPPKQELGELAIELLADGKAARDMSRPLPCRIVMRQSAGAAPRDAHGI